VFALTTPSLCCEDRAVSTAQRLQTGTRERPKTDNSHQEIGSTQHTPGSGTKPPARVPLETTMPLHSVRSQGVQVRGATACALTLAGMQFHHERTENALRTAACVCRVNPANTSGHSHQASTAAWVRQVQPPTGAASSAVPQAEYPPSIASTKSSTGQQGQLGACPKQIGAKQGWESSQRGDCACCCQTDRDILRGAAAELRCGLGGI
jgi:hypothetical protein